MFQDRSASTDAEALALDCLAAGIDAARPASAVERHVELHDDGEPAKLEIRDRTYDLDRYDEVLVLGGGKAADELAAALEGVLGDRLDGGVVVTHDPTVIPDRITVVEGEHPTPGPGSVDGASAVLEAAEAADDRTLVLAAITGGGSALLCAPAGELDVADVRAITDDLLTSGASIDELNAVRRSISRIKGGRLAGAAAPATVAGVLVSDVVGDDPAVIASGPTVPTETAPAEAIAVLERYDVDAPSVRAYLENVPADDPDDLPVDVDNHVVGSNRDAIDAAASRAGEDGYETCVLSTRIEGEAADVGRVHAAVAAEILTAGDPIEPPAVVLSGGETTVAVTGDGVGGPNLESALAAAIDLPEGAVFAAIDTDGSDGSTDAAGAIVDAGTVGDADPARAALEENDSYPFLEACGALLRTGPTGTNVNDLRVLVIS